MPAPTRRSLAAPPEVVAPSLLGATLVVRAPRRLLATIVEVEAYGGLDDPASHAWRGPTPRCAVMFGPPGRLYVYRSYGLHWCANVVTGPAGVAGAVLVRAVAVAGADPQAGAGPGLATRLLGLTGEEDGVDLLDPTSRVGLLARPTSREVPVVSGVRVGISRAREREWRFWWEGHPARSRARG